MTIENSLILICIEWFLYGKISTLCALTRTLVTKEIQLFPGLGLYSGIFAMYVQYPQNKSRTASIISYALSFLYVLSTVSAVADLVALIIEIVSNNPIRKKIIFLNLVVQKNSGNPQLTGAFEFHIGILQGTVNGFCDFLAQCILVRILNHCTHQPFIHLNLQRSTVVGSCGVKLSVSLSFLHSWQSHS